MQYAVRIMGGVIVALLFLLPVTLVWWPGSGAMDGDVTSPPIPWMTLLRSIGVAGGVALLALLIGGSLAFLFAATDFPATTFWGTLALIPFVCPATVWALAQVFCYGPGGVVERALGDGLRPLLENLNQGHYLSTVAVLAQVYAPIAMLFLWRGMGRLHHSGFEAAFLFLSPRRRLVWLVSTLRHELVAAMVLVFAMALGNFAVPHVLQCRLFVIDIYMRTSNYLDHDGAVRAVLPLVLLSIAAVACAMYLDERSPLIRGGPSGQWRFPLGRLRWTVGISLAIYLALSTGLPIGAIVWECGSVTLFLEAVRDASPELSNTIFLGVVVAITAVVAGLATNGLPAGRLRTAGHCLAFVTIGLPALLVALAYVRTASQISVPGISVPGIEAIRRAGVMVMIALAFRAWPFVSRLIVAADRQASPAWREAADLGQMSPFRRWRWITLPWSFDYLVSGAIIAYVISTSDVVICQMLCEPGQGTLALRLFTFLHFGPTHVAANLALLHLLVSCVPVLVYFLVADRCLRIV